LSVVVVVVVFGMAPGFVGLPFPFLEINAKS
jgi:hypothetical protein